MSVKVDTRIQQASTFQFELLDKYMSCPVDSETEWWQRTGPLLASLMSFAGYTDQSQCQYLMFFYTTVVPFLGPYPQTFPSAMTHNEIPLELSINFQQLGGSQPVVRVAVEPLTSISGTKADPYNLSPINDFLHRLKRLNPDGYDSRVFDHFYPKHTLSKSESQELQAKSESIRELSQVAFGFDLKPGNISVKGYTFPDLKSYCAADKNTYSLVLDSIQEYLGEEDRFNTIDMIKSYIESTDAKATFGFVYSNDCITPSKSRHKMYGRTKDMSWNKVEEIWTLGGRVDTPDSNNGLPYLKELWEILEIGDGPHPLGLHLVWNYETKAGLKVPATKIYFPVYGLNDHKNIIAIAHYLERIGLKVHGDNYVKSVEDT